ncbi:MAG: ATP-dependent transcriptional regulator, MalT-like, LuxR family [Acidimicrobiales bacterium]|nr:ATP-dependent transcriptional regulator, MalT-like, LuxR family [Acidimicrobiales bacterium]
MAHGVDRVEALHGPRPDRDPVHAREREAIGRLLDAARAGQGQAIVVRGEVGIGKTTLLRSAVRSASGFQVAQIDGIESERELGFAGLHRLCVGLSDRVDQLPDPQREALGLAFGLSARGVPNRFFVGLAVLRLVSDVAADKPLICVVDDAHLLDRPSMHVLAFVARRVRSERVALAFAVRDRSEELAGVPELVVEALSGAESRALLSSAVPGPLDVRVRDRIVAESQGNPRALLELPLALTPAELAGGFGVPATRPAASQAAEPLASRLDGLPPETRQLLLVAAAEPEGDPVLLWRAATRLGLDLGAASRAESEGLLRFAERVTFVRPHLRSAVYRGASPADRRRVHRALAEALDPDDRPDRRAWHRANASLAPDADVADDLEHAAGFARERGGAAAAAAFLERSARLTPEPGRRATRALTAARAKLLAGAPNAADDLVTTASAGPLSEVDQARVAQLRAGVAVTLRREIDAPARLLRAATALAPLDVPLAREVYLQALEAALFGHGTSLGLIETAEAARTAPPTANPRPVDSLLDGLAALFTDGHPAARPALRRAVDGFQLQDETRWLSLACRAAAELWDDEATRALARRHVRLARAAGTLVELPIALDYLAALQVHAGDFSGASGLLDEADAVAGATGHRRGAHTSLLFAAWCGDEARTAELLDTSVRDVNERGDERQHTHPRYAPAVLSIALGRYRDALDLLGRRHAGGDGLRCWVLPELVEAAARSGEHEVARSAVEKLSERTQLGGTDWGLGIEARARALVCDDSVAEPRYREAIDRLGRCGAWAHVARAHLLYGEWLRRQRRRIDAREHLHTARDMFSNMGAGAFAARAGRELLATGERSRKRTVDTAAHLTAQEAQVAGLARDGRSNPEIGALLFISSRTVEYHLRKVFTKLEIRSRVELEHVLPSSEDWGRRLGTR